MTAGPSELLSPAEVAQRLGVHVRTVRRYIREGTLPAVRIGKRFRVPAAQLDALMGVEDVAAGGASEPSARLRVTASCILDIDGVSEAHARRIVDSALAACKGRDPHDDPLRVEFHHERGAPRLKVIILGSPQATATLLSLLEVLLET